MSDTPRTDKQTFDIECIRGDAHLGRHVYQCGSGDFVESNFARQLERELAAAVVELQTLRTANAGLVERVKRLEEAGDWMANAAERYGIPYHSHAPEVWREAKGQP